MADVFVIKNSSGDDALKGQLHIEFEQAGSVLHQASVIAQIEEAVVATDTVNLQDEDPEGEVSTDEDTGVTVIMVNSEWEETPGGGANQCLVWVDDDPCGKKPEPITEVDNVNDLLNALATAPSGSTVLLLPGEYYPELQAWPGGHEWQHDTIYGHLMLERNITLAGSGSAETKIWLRGECPHYCTGIFVRGSATLRNIQIINQGDSYDSIYISQVDGVPRRLEMCDVIVENHVGLNLPKPGIVHETLLEGPHDVLITDSILRCINCRSSSFDSGWVGLDHFSSWWGQTTTVIENTEVTGWYTGVEFRNTNPEQGTTSVTADCDGFHDNRYGNLRETTQDVPWPGIEHCP
jgi:hypothetical protein